MMPPQKKIRIYSPFFPDPPSGGSPQVVHDQVRALSQLGHSIELVLWKDRPPSQTGFSSAVKIAQCLPQRENSRQRAVRILTSVASKRASPEEYYYPRATKLPALGPVDLAIYHYSFAYNWLADPAFQLPAEKKRVVFFHNLESELFTQNAQAESWPKNLIQKLNASKLELHESELAERVDELWFLSPADRDTYLARNRAVSPARCRLVGPTYSTEIRTLRRARFLSSAPGPDTILGFVGAMDFAPNHESALWILTELAPRLRDAGFRGQILLAGKGAAPELLKKAADFSFVRFLGFVPDLEDGFWAKLSYALIPHVQGSGTRIKLLEALASGVPALASQGIEQRLLPGLRQHPLLHLSDDPADWVRRILAHAPFAERKAALDTPFPKELDGAEIYRFLDSPEDFG